LTRGKNKKSKASRRSRASPVKRRGKSTKKQVDRKKGARRRSTRRDIVLKRRGPATDNQDWALMESLVGQRYRVHTPPARRTAAGVERARPWTEFR
jgi:hypothetical protein